MSLTAAVSLFFLSSLVMGYVDVPCEWKSLTGATYDLTDLMVLDEKLPSYLIKDGDIPCTPEKEPTYSYVFNFCADVTAASFPSNVCLPTQMGSAIQYIDRSDGYKECNVIGHYDPLRDDTYYSLLDQTDPSLGVSVTYQFGQKCPNGKLRSATIDVMCENTKATIDSANEPTECNYHLVVRSQHGCPKECPITSAGVCNSHGHCAYDAKSKGAHCFCNKGYGGDSCLRDTSSEDDGSAVYSLQVALLVVLLVTAAVLTGFVGYLGFRITEFRKEQLMNSYSNYGEDSGNFQGTEMVDRPF